MKLSELFEEVVNVRKKPQLFVIYALTTAFIRKNYKDDRGLKLDLQAKFGEALNCDVDLEVYSNEVDFKIQLDTQDVRTLKDQLDEKVVYILEVHHSFLNTGSNEVRFSPNGQMLPKKLEYDNFRLMFFREKTNSLRNIYKNVAAKKMTVTSAEKIEHGGAGLLLIDNIQRLNFITSGVIIPWCKIVQDCFDNEDDVSDCQEALIDAGFKEHAKL